MIHILVYFKHWKHLSASENQKHGDYCKTKACINRYCSFNGVIVTVCRCDNLLILGYKKAQEVDSKVGELIYPLQRVDLMEFLQHEPIPVRNMKEIHENCKKCYFNWILEPIGCFLQILTN